MESKVFQIMVGFGVEKKENQELKSSINIREKPEG